MSRINDLIKELCPNGVVFKRIGEIANYRRGSFPQPYTNESYYGGEDAMPFVQVADVKDNFRLVDSTKNTISKIAQSLSVFVPKGTVIVTLQGTIGRVAITQYDAYVDRTIAIFEGLSSELNTKYFVYQLKSKFDYEKQFARGSTIKTITKEEMTKFKIPIPPLEIQEEIVKILDKFGELEAELEARKSQYEFWREKLLNTGNSNQQYITLGDIGKVCMCKRIMKNETSDSGDVPFYKIGTFGKKADAYISYDIFNDYKKRFSYPKKGEILVSCSGTIGRSVVFDGEDAYFQDSNIVWLSNDESKVLNKFLYYFYQTSPWNISDGGTIKRLYNNQFISAKVPLYSLEEQKKIINILERFDKLINDIAVGLPAEIELRRKQYEYYRNKLLSFEELSVSE